MKCDLRLYLYVSGLKESTRCMFFLKLFWFFFQVHSDFVGAATRGAMAVIDGNVMAINPGEDAK